MTSLRQQLERLSGPVEVDILMGLVHRLETTIEAESTGLSSRCRRIVAELNEAVVGVDEAIAVMNDVAGQSGHGAGLMATMRSTFAGARVDEVRQRALGHREADALRLAREVRVVREEVEEPRELRDNNASATTAAAATAATAAATTTRSAPAPRA